MNVIQKFKSLDRVSKCAVILFGTVATIYGGSKHTNNVPPLLGLGLRPRPAEVSTLTNWHTRGAWIDWLHIDLPSSFRFPRGTNFIHSVTLMSYGALKTSLRPQPTTNNQQLTTTLAAFPSSVSLEPDVTTVTHGLTPSNTYLFAWQDACVNRDATNRVDASIELFPNGSIATTFGNTVERVAPYVPEDFVGEGQDLAWATNAFPFAATNIVGNGYAAWLDNWVGINQQNGRYQVAVTVGSLPDNGVPCYLVCGPYKVNVTAPGTFRFPLEVYREYETRTYPEAVPLTFTCDDGYRGSGASYEFYTKRNQSATQTGNLPRMTMAGSVQNAFYYFLKMIPYVVVSPDNMTVEEANGATIKVWCNVQAIRKDFQASMDNARITFGLVDDVELQNIIVGGYIDFLIESNFDTAVGRLVIEELYPSRAAEHAFVGQPYHAFETNGWTVTSVAVDSCTGSASFDIPLQSNGVYYVAVFMATKEDIFENGWYYSDTVSWSVTAGGATLLSGSTDVQAHEQDFRDAWQVWQWTYGMMSESVHLGGVVCSSVQTGGSLHVEIEATDVGDQNEHTAVQVMVYPVDLDGTVLTLPDWVSFGR